MTALVVVLGVLVVVLSAALVLALGRASRDRAAAVEAIAGETKAREQAATANQALAVARSAHLLD